MSLVTCEPALFAPPPNHPPPQITPSLKALVPPLHMSDVGSKKAKSKYKEGQTVEGRVLSVDPDAKKLRLTLKKALLGSKLPPLADLRQAAPGAKAHGTITGVRARARARPSQPRPPCHPRCHSSFRPALLTTTTPHHAPPFPLPPKASRTATACLSPFTTASPASCASRRWGYCRGRRSTPPMRSARSYACR
jgi:hypothetical protein